MTDFKVGDKVRLRGVTVVEPMTVTGVGIINGNDVIAVESNTFINASSVELVEPREPAYRLYTGTFSAWASVSGAMVVIDFGPTNSAKTVEEAEAAVRAAMGALGYKEEQD